MKHITSSSILFTRTLTKDYRWIFWDDKILEHDQAILRKDFTKFESEKDFYLHHDHLFVRMLTNGIAMYKFLDTEQYDSSMRKIYALSGIAFLNEQYDNLVVMLSSVIADCFLNLKYTNRTMPENIKLLNETHEYPIALLFKTLYEDEEPNITKLKTEIEKFYMVSNNTHSFLLVYECGKITVQELSNEPNISEKVSQNQEKVILSENPKKTIKSFLFEIIHLRRKKK